MKESIAVNCVLFLSFLIMLNSLFLLWSQSGYLDAERFLNSLSPVESFLDRGEDELENVAGQRRGEVLILAQAMYSETKTRSEQEIVGWVIRNRVKSRRWGKSYREVVLTPNQFSAFSDPRKRRFYLLLDEGSGYPGWKETLRLAHQIYFAPAEKNPVPGVFHFYSPRGMKWRTPRWARGRTPLKLKDVDPSRLRVFERLR